MLKVAVILIGMILVLGIINVKQSNRIENFKAELSVEACVHNQAYTDELFPQCLQDYYQMKGWAK